MFFYNIGRVKLYYINKALFFSVLFVLVIFLIIFPLRKNCLKLSLSLVREYIGEPFFVLSEGLPGTFFTGLEGKYFDYPVDWGAWGEQVVKQLTGVNISSPFSLLCWELNLVDKQAANVLLSDGTPLIEVGGEEDFYLPSQEEELKNWLTIPEDQYPPVELHGEPMVLIYTTHNAESYQPTQGASRLEGKNGGIANVSQTLVNTLENKHGLKTIYSKKIHDYPDFTKAYYNSMQTVKKYLQEYDKIQVVLDIHRDAGLKKRSDTLVKIKGKDCAKVLIVVGTAHAQWRQNWAFAQKLEKKANELYPGLIKSVRLFKDRVYNQNLHTRALLLEFGSDLNKESDAVESAKLMADVIAAVLKE